MEDDISKILKNICDSIIELKLDSKDIKTKIEYLTSVQEKSFVSVDTSLHLISGTLMGPIQEDIKEIKRNLGLKPRNWVEEQKKIIKRIKLPVSTA